MAITEPDPLRVRLTLQATRIQPLQGGQAMSNVEYFESALFKRVAGGHVFQAPNPWLFGQGSRYLVNDTQKAQLLAIATPRRPMLRVAVMTAGIALWVV